MAANANFTTKLTLREANVVRRSLEARMAELMKLISPAHPDDLKALRDEAGVIDKLLRVDF